MLLTPNTVFWFRFQNNFTTNIGNPALQGTLTYTATYKHTTGVDPAIVTTSLGKCLRLNRSCVRYNRPNYFFNYSRALNGAKSVVSRYVKASDDEYGWCLGGLLHNSSDPIYYYLGEINPVSNELFDLIQTGNLRYRHKISITFPSNGSLETVAIAHPANLVTNNLLPRIVYCFRASTATVVLNQTPQDYLFFSEFYFGSNQSFTISYATASPRKYMKDVAYFNNTLTVEDLKRVSLGLHPLKGR